MSAAFRHHIPSAWVRPDPLTRLAATRAGRVSASVKARSRVSTAQRTRTAVTMASTGQITETVCISRVRIIAAQAPANRHRASKSGGQRREMRIFDISV